MKPAISVAGLTRRYRGQLALDDVTFDVEGGSITGLVILAMAGNPAQAQSGALAAIYMFFFVLGLLSIARSLPFALAVGVSRRAYFTGTVLLAVALAGLTPALLQAAERATCGWGMTLRSTRPGSPACSPPWRWPCSSAATPPIRRVTV